MSSANGSQLRFERYPIGSFLELAPHHSCASTHQHREIYVLDDDGERITDSWAICKGW